MGCPRIFVQDPERYLLDQQIRIPDAARSAQPARLDSTLRARVNHELYYFADRAGRDRFWRDPLRYCGIVTDPVSRKRFRPSWRSPRTDYHGQPYFFTDRLTYRTFKAVPDSFAIRKGA